MAAAVGVGVCSLAIADLLHSCSDRVFATHVEWRWETSEDLADAE